MIWNMIWQENSRVIVMLNGTKEQSEQSGQSEQSELRNLQYFAPTQDNTLIKDFIIKEERIKRNSHYTKTNLKVTYIETGEVRLIHHFKYLDWPDNEVPDIKNLIDFLVVVNRKDQAYFKKVLQTNQRNLIKPFLLVAPDGHIVDVFGPYPASLSDSDIMKSPFENENSILRTHFRPNDIFILDRGFRDSIPLLKSLGYKVHKPENILPADSQLTTINANKTRYVTLCRWVVEVINGRFKNEFKLFKAEYFNLASTHLMDDFRICATLINTYHVKLRDRPDAKLILSRVVERFTVSNCQAEYVTENNINRRRTQFIPIDAQHKALDVFPQMICILTLNCLL
ncbi:unnamed protein product [Euphydryas editha]|uniref:Tyrosine-protein phosphatase domain-containing protein n=1 Tax=Euphydryas editha TaxID=104508 RepID=A0AAU9TQY4_EUPED|nr:unnamed protein product [Euphydryas editha]